MELNQKKEKMQELLQNLDYSRIFQISEITVFEPYAYIGNQPVSDFYKYKSLLQFLEAFQLKESYNEIEDKLRKLGFVAPFVRLNKYGNVKFEKDDIFIMVDYNSRQVTISKGLDKLVSDIDNHEKILKDLEKIKT